MGLADGGHHRGQFLYGHASIRSAGAANGPPVSPAKTGAHGSWSRVATAQRDPESLSRIPGVEAVIGNTHKNDLVEIVDSAAESALTADELADVYRQEFVKVRTLEGAAAGSPGRRVRPFVKVQDGCDAKCTYCIIPLVRGPGRSLPPEQVLAQVRDLARKGFQEVVLTGIHIGTYGMHLKPRYPLDRLLAAVAETPGLVRVRLSSIEPMELSRRVIELAAGNDRICPHFHICLQSGSNRILRKMWRPYDTSRFGEIVQEIRARLPQASIGTDLVVGFPRRNRPGPPGNHPLRSGHALHLSPRVSLQRPARHPRFGHAVQGRPAGSPATLLGVEADIGGQESRLPAAVHRPEAPGPDPGRVVRREMGGDLRKLHQGSFSGPHAAQQNDPG